MQPTWAWELGKSDAVQTEPQRMRKWNKNTAVVCTFSSNPKQNKTTSATKTKKKKKTKTKKKHHICK